MIEQPLAAASFRKHNQYIIANSNYLISCRYLWHLNWNIKNRRIMHVCAIKTLKTRTHRTRNTKFHVIVNFNAIKFTHGIFNICKKKPKQTANKSPVNSTIMFFSASLCWWLFIHLHAAELHFICRFFIAAKIQIILHERLGHHKCFGRPLKVFFLLFCCACRHLINS